MDVNLKKINDFFNVDIKIKEELYNLAPTEEVEYNEETKMKYVDNVERTLKQIKKMIEKTEKDFNLSCEKSSIKSFFDKCNTKLAEFNYKNGDLKKLYQQILSDMDDKLISKVNENCIGYSDLKSPYGLVEKCNTVNELLHVYHSYITNNENFYKTIPKQCSPKTNEQGYEITLYGMDNELAKEVFEKFPLDMDNGEVDILSLENRVLMMIRDRGHALTIELLENEDGNITTKYFIPKICNVEMINNLKGVTKINDNSKFAKGIFESKREEILDDLYTFINGVPMDKDMIFKPINKEEFDAIEDKTEKEYSILQDEIENSRNISQDEISELTNHRCFSNVKGVFKNFIQTVKNLGKELDKDEYARDE